MLRKRTRRVCPAAADAVWKPSIGVGARGSGLSVHQCHDDAEAKAASLPLSCPLLLFSRFPFRSDTRYVLLARILACALHCTPSNFHHRFTINSIHLTAARGRAAYVLGRLRSSRSSHSLSRPPRLREERAASASAERADFPFHFLFVSFRN